MLAASGGEDEKVRLTLLSPWRPRWSASGGDQSSTALLSPSPAGVLSIGYVVRSVAVSASTHTEGTALLFAVGGKETLSVFSLTASCTGRDEPGGDVDTADGGVRVYARHVAVLVPALKESSSSARSMAVDAVPLGAPAHMP